MYDIAAGGVESVPFAVESNLNRALKLSRRVGLWNLGTSEHAERSVWQVDRERPWLIVVGNEQKGLRRLVLEHCDEICQIPATGDVGSLNVSVATGILLAALDRPGNA
ncbi:MAG: TrmH family RNA methyltransferase [Planctomycetaceae bacterium]